EQALLLRRHRGDPGRNDLALFRDVALQHLHVLVVDRRRVGAGERANLAPAAERAARGQVGDVDFLLCHVSLLRTGAAGRRGGPQGGRGGRSRGSARGGRSRRSSRGGRSPKSRRGRSPRSRSPPKPPPPKSSSRRLRSSRSLRAMTGEGSSESLSTFTVR